MKEVTSKMKDADLITSQVVADRLSISVRTLWRWVREGRIPEPIRVNRKMVRWKKSVIDATIAAM
jgi:predicted DNA-binding transcriptional regulator AlpA